MDPRGSPEITLIVGRAIRPKIILVQGSPMRNIIHFADILIQKLDSNNSTQIWRRKIYYSGRDKENARSKYCLKYTVGVQVSTGQICFVDGPRPGSMSDITALRESGLLSSIRLQNLDEVVLGDKGYVDKNVPNILTPVKKPPLQRLTPEQDAFNQIISSVRIIVERSLGRIKIFNILMERFRKGSCKVEDHRVISSMSVLKSLIFHSKENHYRLMIIHLFINTFKRIFK